MTDIPEHPETILTRVVRDQIQEKLGLNDKQCQFEVDETPAHGFGDRYVAVIPGGWSATGSHTTSGLARTEEYAVQVSVILRTGNIPADKRRSAYAANSKNLNQMIRTIIEAVDWNYREVLAAANKALEQRDGFYKPLRFDSVEPGVRSLTINDSGGAEIPVLIRAIRFSGAELKTRLTL